MPEESLKRVHRSDPINTDALSIFKLPNNDAGVVQRWNRAVSGEITGFPRSLILGINNHVLRKQLAEIIKPADATELKAQVEQMVNLEDRPVLPSVEVL
jgi:hypothetical protein